MNSERHFYVPTEKFIKEHPSYEDFWGDWDNSKITDALNAKKGGYAINTYNCEDLFEILQVIQDKVNQCPLDNKHKIKYVEGMINYLNNLSDRKIWSLHYEDCRVLKNNAIKKLKELNNYLSKLEFDLDDPYETGEKGKSSRKVDFTVYTWNGFTEDYNVFENDIDFVNIKKTKLYKDYQDDIEIKVPLPKLPLPKLSGKKRLRSKAKKRTRSSKK